MNELELKIEIDEPTAERLQKDPALSRFSDVGAESRHLRTIYLDTPDGALGKAGIALRLRFDGQGWCQTVKARQSMAGGLSEAAESDLPLAGPEPDLEAIPDVALKRRVLSHLGGMQPEPVFETDVLRTTRVLTLPQFGTVELAIDGGEIRANGRTQRIDEVEIELLSGQANAVFDAARRLFPDGGVQPSLLSKAEKGSRLAQGGGANAPQKPRKARVAALKPSLTTEQGARAIFSECLAQVTANLAVVSASDDPEGPHQLRVGLRRLRSAALVFGPALGGDRLRHIVKEAKWLSNEAGRVRDLDVALADILGPMRAEMSNEPGLESLEQELASHAQAARTSLRGLINGPRTWAFLLDLGEYTAARGWLDPADWDQTARLARPLADTARKALDTRLARVMRRGRKIASLEIEARHDLRKELKKLRYMVEFFATIYPPKTVRPFVKRLKKLQDVFGDLQDVAMAEALFRAPDGPGSGSVASARAAGFVIGVRTERAHRSWTQARGLWGAFTRSAPFWR